MTITSIVGSDGSIRITLDGHELKLREVSVDAARRSVLDHAKSYAASTGAVQKLTAIDPAGEWIMYVSPAGDVSPASDVAPAQIAPPAPAPIPVAPLRIAPRPTVPIARPPAPAAPVDERAHHADVDHTVLLKRRPRPTVTVRLDNGDGITVAVPALLGRRPTPKPGYSTVALDSPNREVSRVHALVDVDEDGRITVVDEHSANGTSINGQPVPPGVVVAVPPGAQLELGDVTVRIEHTHKA